MYDDKGKSGDRSIVLVVDDDPTNLRVLLEYLTDSGFETWIARSGEDALRQIDYALPDIILLDVMMPGIDGFETCSKLKQKSETKDIPVIFMTALCGTEGKIRGFEVGGIDYITKPFQQEEVLARIEAHLLIKRQKKELHELNAMKDKFFSIIAHDMKGAFNTLYGFSELLSLSISRLNIECSRDLIEKSQQDAEGTFKLLKKIEKFSVQMYEAVQGTYKLLDNLLDWARIQNNTMDYKPQRLNLRQHVWDNIYILHENASFKGISLTNSVKDDVFIHADRNMIQTILRNLVSNAIKFTDSGGTIDVSSHDMGDYVNIMVSDNGVGISNVEKKSLFQIDKPHKKRGTAGESGTGLGLILCKELVEKHNGIIEVESRLNEGATFLFTIPQSKADRSSAR